MHQSSELPNAPSIAVIQGAKFIVPPDQNDHVCFYVQKICSYEGGKSNWAINLMASYKSEQKFGGTFRFDEHVDYCHISFSMFCCCVPL